jgi:hypothetical protein
MSRIFCSTPGGTSPTYAKMSHEGAGDPALRDQANGLGPRNPFLFLAGSPERAK